MRILVVGLGRVNTSNKDGGAIRLFNILKYFIKRGVSVDVILPERDITNFKQYEVRARFIIFRDLPIFRMHSYIIYTQRIIKGVFFCLKSEQSYDVVYCASDFWHDFLPSLVLKLKHPKTKLVTCIFLMAPPPFKSYETMFTQKLVFPNPKRLLFYFSQRFTIWVFSKIGDLLLVLNELDKAKIVNLGVSEEKIHVVSMGVDQIMKRKIYSPKKYEACFVGRFHPQKGIGDLVEIWQRVCVSIPNARLVVIGGGTERQISLFTTRIKQMNLTHNIFYMGYMDGDGKNNIMKSSQMLLVPSHYESWGQVIAEGLTLKIPVLTYNLPIFENIFHKTIIRAACFNKKEFSDNIIKIIRNKMSTGARTLQGYQLMKNYYWNMVGTIELNLVSDLIGEK